MLAVKRFDEKDGQRLGFEDFTVLNAKTAEQKYKGSIESGLLRRAAEFTRGAERGRALESIYHQTVLNTMLRNGDAHLKNYGLLYERADGDAWLSPAFDIVTTTAWIKDDLQALMLNGTRRWPVRDELLKLAPRAKLTRAKAVSIIDQTADALERVLPQLRDRLLESGYEETAEAVVEAWTTGLESVADRVPSRALSHMP